MPPTISACRDFTKRTLRDIIHGEELELEGEVEAAGRRVFRSRVALGIVALSILSALAGWRASVFDEASSTSAALYLISPAGPPSRAATERPRGAGGRRPHAVQPVRAALADA